MTGYVIGTQAWYDHERQRLADISKKLDPVNKLTDDERERLYAEQNQIISELEDNWHEGLVNNPLNL